MSTKKKILVVTESIDIDDSSGTKGRVALIKNLDKAGFHLKVYHYTRKNYSLDGIQCVAIPEKKVTFNYFMSKTLLLLWRLLNKDFNSIFEKRLGFSFGFFNDSYSIKEALLKEDEFHPDWVLTLSKAASFRTHKALLGLPKWHDKWLAYIHDPYPMHFYPRPYNWVTPGYYQQQEFFREVSKRSAHAVFPSHLLMEWMGSYYPDFIQRGLVIPHQIIDVKTKNLYHPSYFKKTGFTILHAGSLMKPRNPKGLVEAFELFLNKNPEAKPFSQLLLIGPKSYFKEYLDHKQKQISQLYLSSGYVKYSDVELMQELASVNVILEAKSEISPFLPGKFPHCVKANRPILYLGPKQSETLRLLGTNYPFLSEIDDSDTIAKHIEELYNNWKNNGDSQYLNRPDLEAYLSFNNVKKVLESLNQKQERYD